MKTTLFNLTIVALSFLFFGAFSNVSAQGVPQLGPNTAASVLSDDNDRLVAPVVAEIRVFPNPLNSGTNLNLQLFGMENQVADVTITNIISGETVFEKGYIVEEEFIRETIPTTDIEPGQYILRVSVPSSELITEMILIQ